MEVDVLEAIAHGLIITLTPLLPAHGLWVRAIDFGRPASYKHAFQRLSAGTAWQVVSRDSLPFVCLSLGEDWCKLYLNPPDEEVEFSLADPGFPGNLVSYLRSSLHPETDKV